MANATDVKSLLLEVDASVELLRRNLLQGDRAVATFQQDTQRRLDQTDRRFDQLGQGMRGLGPSIAQTRAQIATVGTAVERVERQVRSSTAGIRSALLSSASGFAAAFSAAKVAEYTDSYTRFTNQLKTAGLEGARASSAQERIFGVAQKNGVNLEKLGELYGNVASLQKDLNLSDADTVKITGAVAAALKIKGASAEQAAGAILGLVQALGNGKFQAEEFNQVNDGARPLLQAAADASEKYRGSLGKLRQDVLAGTISSKDLAQMVLASADALDKRGAKATLTLGASLTTLNNALTVGIGQMDGALSASERLSGGITFLARNLDTVLPALTSIAIGFGVTKVAGLALDGVAAVLGRVAGADREVARQVLLGNASFIDRTAVAARSAVAVQEAAAAELRAVEATIAARRQEQAVLAQTITEQEALAATKRAEAALAANSNVNNTAGRTAALRAQARAEDDASFATQNAASARGRLTVVTTELAAAEGRLAGATAASVAATEAATAATAAATFGARAAAAASALLAGTLNLVKGALPIIAIAAVVAAFIAFRNAAAEADAQTKAFADRHREAAEALRQTSIYGSQAASSITQSGTAASTATPKMLAFAGAVGEAAQKLRDLADARRKDALAKLQEQGNAAGATIREGTARIASRQTGTFSPTVMGGVGSSDAAADARDRAAVAQARTDLTNLRRRYQSLRDAPAEGFLSESERNGGRDVAGDLARARSDLAIAQAGGNKPEVNRLKSIVGELTKYKELVKGGASDESARAQAAEYGRKLREAGEGRLGRQASAAAGRAATRAEAKRVAEVKDAAGDERAFKAAERQANDKIAAARAEQSNSAEQRAQIERDRIAADLASRNDELDLAVTTGRYTKQRAEQLKKLNTTAAAEETAVVDLRERRRAEAEAAAVADRRYDVQVDMAQVEVDTARTIRARREAELRLLAAAKDQERAKLNRLLAPNSGASEGDRAIARVDLETLDSRYAARAGAIGSRNLSPLEDYRDRLVAATEDMDEALENVEVGGLQSLEDGLVGVIEGTESLGSAFKKMTAGIIADLARIAVRKAILSGLGSIGLKFADGGVVPKAYATGGIITGPGTGTSDSILARVSAGEGILTADALRHYGAGIVGALNDKRLPRFATGGVVGGGSIPSLRAPRVPDLRGTGAGVQRVALDAHVQVDAGPEFEARMTGVSARVVGAAAEPIMAGAEARTMRRISRPSLPGAPG